MTYERKNKELIEVIVTRKKNKNIYFRVKNDLKLYVTCPIYMSSNSILKLISENEDAIEVMYNKAYEKAREDELFWYLGNKYIIKIDENASKVDIKDGEVITPSIEELEAFYQSEVKRVFTEEVELAKKCFNNLPEFTLKFRYMVSRWGVCNRGKNIVTLNTELLKKDIKLLDYVIIHELCHFFEGNHGANFWHLVSLAYPNYKEARKELRS